MTDESDCAVFKMVSTEGIVREHVQQLKKRKKHGIKK